MTNDYYKLPDRKTSNNLIPKQAPQRDIELMTWQEFQQKKSKNWREYKIYLRDNGALSPKLFHTV